MKKPLLLVLFVLMGAGFAFAQNYQVSGKVTDAATNEPLAFVTVVEKGSTRAVVTDDDGNYRLNVSGVNAVVVFQLMGYTQMEMIVAGPTLDAAMDSDVQRLDEVIVVAYGTAKKSTFTGSAALVNRENVEKLSVSNVTESLQGMSAGVTVLNGVGSPGQDAKILIRGIGSMSASTDPLYVVDGVPFAGNISSIATTDIENISVMKDAVAASLYGSRAANGVVMITTKKGTEGRPKVNFRSTWGSNDIATKYPTKATPQEHLEIWWEALYNDQFYTLGQPDALARQTATNTLLNEYIRPLTGSSGQTVYVNPYNMNNPVATNGKLDPNAQMVWNESDYDWFGAVFSPKLRQEYSLDISGASDRTNYFISGSYTDDKGYSTSQRFSRYTMRSSVSTKVNKVLEAGVNMYYSHTDANTGSGMVRVIRTVPSIASPWLRNNDNTDWLYSEVTGNRMLDYGTIRLGWDGWNPFSESGDYRDNPDGRDFRNNSRDVLSARTYLNVNFFEGLNFRTNFSLERNNNYTRSYSSAIHGKEQQEPYGVAVKTAGGSSTRNTTNRTAYTWNNLLTYDKSIGEHNLSVLLGQEIYQTITENTGSSRPGIPFAYLYEVSSGTRTPTASSSRDEYALFSLFTKLEYNYVNKYYLSGSYRRDGSSRFHPDSRYGNFFSAGGSWRLSQEAFLQDVSWIDNITLKASWGTTGNDRINTNYAYQGTYGAYNLYSDAGLRITATPNSTLLWEKNEQINFGTDFRLFKWLYGEVEYFIRNSRDLLFAIDLPYSARAGDATNYNTNLGTIRNSGLEVSLNVRAYNTQKFKWTIDGNFTYLKNEVTSLPVPEYNHTPVGFGVMRMAEGHSVYEFWAPSWAGIDPATGDVQYWEKVFDANGNVIDRRKTSVYDDVNNDLQKEFKGSTIPKYYGSLTNTFRAYGFDFSFMLYYSLGAYMADYDYCESSSVRSTFAFYPELIENRWKQPGDIATIGRSTHLASSETRRYTDFYIFKNDYLRLRNITLGYTIPKSLTEKVGLSSVRVYVTGDNMLTFGAATKRGSDPETNIQGSNYGGNYETNTRKVYMGGIQISF